MVMMIVMRVMIKLVMRWHNEFLGPYSTPGSVLRPSYILPSPQLSPTGGINGHSSFPGKVSIRLAEGLAADRL